MGTRDPSDYAGAKGQISKEHGGIDIRAEASNPIYAAMSGTVVGTSPDYGTVEIKHPGGWVTKYLHMGKFAVKSGDNVTAGDVIGEAGGIGKSGREVYNPHLHFEMIKDGTKVDPETVFQSYNGSQINRTRKQQIENASALGVGGPDFRPSITQQNIKEVLNNSTTEKVSVQMDDVVAELKKLQQLLGVLIKKSGGSNISVSAPSISGGDQSPKNTAVGSGDYDQKIENMFSQVGGMLSNFNIAATGMGTTVT